MKRQFSGAQRLLRVGEVIRRLLAEYLRPDGLRDPGLKGRRISVSEVRASADLRVAHVYVTISSTEDRPSARGLDHESGPSGSDIKSQPDALVREALNALERAAHFLSRKVGGELHLKYAPRLYFHLDDRFDASARIEHVLKGLKEEGQKQGNLT